MSDVDREELIQAYHRILCLEPEKERKRLAQTRMYELVTSRPKAFVEAMETRLFGRPLR